ncbi:MAG: site-specific DNA-methyltransferase [candidate division Zixibacteria bacterium]|nr:site-specific DNA-methyltransferase [candidate division Zixibacteria bacterium]
MIKPYYDHKGIGIYNCAYEEILPELEPVDLVMIDPPYGIRQSFEKNRAGGNKAKAGNYGNKTWDDKPIDFNLLWELLSLGKYACCFGGNYYPMPPSSCWLVWDKENTGGFADCELAWTNYRKAVRLIRHQWNGMLRKGKEPRYHPTQKPLAVIKWAIELAPKYNTILDPMMGSGTTLAAAKDLGRKAIGIEKEEKYCEIAARRLQQEVLFGI